MIHLLIVEDQKTILQLLKSYLEREPNLKIVAVATNGQAGIEKVDKFKPDVVLMDVEMPGIDGITATRIISERHPETKVLILTTHDDDQTLNLALQAGAKGYILKTAPAEELIKFIHSVHQGDLKLGSGLVQKIQPEIHPISSKPKQPEQSVPKTPYVLLGVVLNCLVWVLIIVYWKITPPKYTSEWGMKILETGTGVQLNLPSIGRASSDSSSAGGRKEARIDYVYIANDSTVTEEAAEKMGISPGDFGKPEITSSDDGNIISLTIEGDTPTQAQQKAYTFNEVFNQRIESLRQGEIKRQEKQTQTTLEKARENLDEAQKKLSSYQASSSLSSEEQIKQLASNLEQLRLQQAELSAQEEGLNNLSQQLGRELELSSNEATSAYKLLEDNVYQEQLQQYAKAKTELANLLSRFTPQNPSVINKQAELEETTTALQQRAAFLLNRSVSRTELERITYLTLDPKVKTVRQDVFKDLITNQGNRQKLEAQIRELKNQMEELEGRQRDLAQKKLNMDSLQRDLQVAEAIFATTLAKLDLGKEHVYSLYPPIQLIKEPSLPKEEHPTSPNVRLLLLAGMAGSFLVSTGLVLLWFERQPSRLGTSPLSTKLPSLSFDSKADKFR
ncbi:MAG: response regulator [Xenococcaceae cyanobacterium MO_167.B27]|nr:response regulator [Xenococcaceae cyanobacterium MO_167.B27]